jgi:hypothetical protein
VSYLCYLAPNGDWSIGLSFRTPYKSDLATDLYSGSTPIANIDESDRWISFNRLNKSVISLSAAIETSGSPLGPRIERDLATDLYSSSTPIAIKDESNHRISFKKSTTSLQVVIIKVHLCP